MPGDADILAGKGNTGAGGDVIVSRHMLLMVVCTLPGRDSARFFVVHSVKSISQPKRLDKQFSYKISYEHWFVVPLPKIFKAIITSQRTSLDFLF
jgi:hypothetical protein